MIASNLFPEIEVQNGLIDLPSSFSPLFLTENQQVMIISDTGVAPLYVERLIKTLKLIPFITQIDSLIIPEGDEHKTLEKADFIFTQLIERRYYRETYLIALGGGMIGDLTGFCAACYLRGVAFIQVPTTLLAQVDAAIGGKVAVNHPLGKNLIGAFYQPKKIICDLSTLDSLPDREFIAGLAEVLKYGLSLDEDFFIWLEKNTDFILARKTEYLDYIVRHSAYLKMQIVSKDEREKGKRIFLNFGHTLAHALESVLQFKELSHGEAVSIGLLAAVMLSQKLCRLEGNIEVRLQKLLTRIELSTKIPGHLSAKALMQAMQRDKKNKTNQTQWVLITHLGQPRVVANVSEPIVYEVLIQLGAQP